MPAEVCKPLQKLKLVKADWTWNRICQDLYNRGKKVVKKDAFSKCYDTSRPQYLETDTSDVCLAAELLQIRDGMNCGHGKLPDNATLHPIAFSSKSQLSVEWHYRSIELEALGILHKLQKFHLYCFVRKVCIITDHKLLVTTLSKDVTFFVPAV